LARFSTEKILAEELCKITEALEAKDIDKKSIFLKGTVMKKAKLYVLSISNITAGLNLGLY
jgi:hypothetical protein